MTATAEYVDESVRAFGESARELARSWSRGDFLPQPSERYKVADFDKQFGDCLARTHFDGAGQSRFAAAIQ